jgi:hypothetical protein
MLPSHIEDFARGCLVDNRLAAMSLEAHEVIAPALVIQLAAEAQALYMTVALACRNFERPLEYRLLWVGAHEFFDAACRIWADAPLDGELLASHRALLEHLRETSRDQVEFYTLTPGDRFAYQTRKVDFNEKETDFRVRTEQPTQSPARDISDG